MTNFQRLSLAGTACALLFGVAPVASAQDLSRYRDIAFGSSVATVIAATGVTAAEVKPPYGLTPRELEVLQALAGGLTNRAIARRLAVSENTVKFHVSSILTKLDAASRAEAVALAARRGLLLL